MKYIRKSIKFSICSTGWDQIYIQYGSPI